MAKGGYRPGSGRKSKGEMARTMVIQIKLTEDELSDLNRLVQAWIEQEPGERARATRADYLRALFLPAHI